MFHSVKYECSLKDRLKKIKEESEEVILAAANGDIENLKEEVADVFQANINFIDAIGLDIDEMMDINNRKHKNRGKELGKVVFISRKEHDEIMDRIVELVSQDNKNILPAVESAINIACAEKGIKRDSFLGSCI